MGDLIVIIVAIAMGWTAIVSVLCFLMTRRFVTGVLLSLTLASVPILAAIAYKGPTPERLTVLGLFLLAALLPTIVIGALFTVDRHDRKAADKTHCRNCGYDLTGNVSGICPECGVRREDRQGGVDERAIR
jgi:hypothetical protein